MAEAKKKAEVSIEDQLIDAKDENKKLKESIKQKDAAYQNLANEFNFFVQEVQSHLKVSTGSMETLSRRTAGYQRLLNPPRPQNAPAKGQK